MAWVAVVPNSLSHHRVDLRPDQQRPRWHTASEPAERHAAYDYSPAMSNRFCLLAVILSEVSRPEATNGVEGPLFLAMTSRMYSPAHGLSSRARRRGRGICF